LWICCSLVRMRWHGLVWTCILALRLHRTSIFVEPICAKHCSQFHCQLTAWSEFSRACFASTTQYLIDCIRSASELCHVRVMSFRYCTVLTSCTCCDQNKFWAPNFEVTCNGDHDDIFAWQNFFQLQHVLVIIDSAVCFILFCQPIFYNILFKIWHACFFVFLIRINLKSLLAVYWRLLVLQRTSQGIVLFSVVLVSIVLNETLPLICRVFWSVSVRQIKMVITFGFLVVVITFFSSAWWNGNEISPPPLIEVLFW